jgi:hypothetical protein
MLGGFDSLAGRAMANLETIAPGTGGYFVSYQVERDPLEPRTLVMHAAAVRRGPNRWALFGGLLSVIAGPVALVGLFNASAGILLGVGLLAAGLVLRWQNGRLLELPPRVTATAIAWAETSDFTGAGDDPERARKVSR